MTSQIIYHSPINFAIAKFSSHVETKKGHGDVHRLGASPATALCRVSLLRFSAARRFR